MRERLDRLGERWPWFGTALRVQQRYSELNGNYLATAITLAGFLSLFPLLLLSIAILGFFSSQSGNLADDIIRHLGLTGEAATAVTSAITTAEKSRKAASAIGLAGLLWSGLGLVATLQYVFNTVWQIKGRGLRDKLGGLVWLGGAGVLFLGSFAMTAGVGLLPGVFAPVAVLLALVVDVMLWLWTMKVLPNREVGWRPLLPGAVLGGVGLEVLKVLGSFYVPRAVGSASAMYGSLGVVFAILAWLLFFGRLVVYSSVVNVVRWEEDHGTVTVELEAPRVPGTEPAEATRAGEVVPSPDVSVPERVT